MTNNFSTDDAILKKIIIGRVEPKIYAFETGIIPKYLKVGDTYRSVDERLNEWRKEGFYDLNLVGEWSSEIKGEDTYFRDYSVHSYLKNNGKESLTKDIFPGKPFSQEFFKDASKDDVEKAITDIVTSFKKGHKQYEYYSIYNKTTIETEYKRDEKDWDPRKPLQTDTIEKFKLALENGRRNLLMYAVMRFGKSFTSLCCAKAMDAKFVLVVSGKADVADEWKQNVQKPKQFDNFKFLISKELKRNDKAISDAQAAGKCIVLFLTLQDLAKEKKRFSELFNSKIDLMIIDETHFGARAETLGKVISDAHYKEDTTLKQIEKADGIDSESLGGLQPNKAEKVLEKETKELDVKVKLHLSGTPYRILLGSEFEDEDVISFCQYSDIIYEKEKWYKENIAGVKQEETGKEEWDNPYYGFPEMIRFAFNLNESSMNKIKALEEQGYSYHLSALFAPKSVEKDADGNYQKFEYEQEVLDFLQSIDGTKNDRNVLSFLDNKRIKEGKLCRHMVMVMPYCASCDAMEKLINDNKAILKNLSDYELINISGVNSQYNKIEQVKSKISSCEAEDKKTITLTVNRMLTGCTVPQWDTMIFLKDTSSPQDYDQAIFRLQSQYVVTSKGTQGNIIKKDMKPQTLLIDFNPHRMFYLQETKSRINNINTADGGNDESEERIKRDLEVSPIIHISENRLVEVTPTDVLKAVSEYSTNRGITEAAKDIIVDENLMNFEDVVTVIKKEFEIGSAKGFAEQAYTGEETDLEDDDINTNGNPDENPNDNKNNNENGNNNTNGQPEEKETDTKVFVNKCRSYYRRILFYAFLSKGDKEIKNLSDVIESVQAFENKRIFENLGMNEDFVKLLKTKMSGTALRSLDDKIYDLYRLSHEYENSDDDPIKRATTAIQRFGKISDSEVVTPQRIAKEMVDLIPEDDFRKVFESGNKFLDIASKMGEFAVAIYRRAESLGIPKETIKNSIYSIPTSNIAYEFTRFVYEKLDLNEDNLAKEFNSYDLLNFTDKRRKVDYEFIAKFLKQNKPLKYKKTVSKIIEGDEILNFDVVIGNPPYQSNVSSSKSNQSLGKQLYPSFIQLSHHVTSKYCSLITPSRWFTGDAQDKSFLKLRAFLKDNNHMKEMHIYPTADKVFNKDVTIKGGVNFFLTDETYSGKTEFHTFKDGMDSVETRNLFEEGFDIVFRTSLDYEIAKKATKDSSSLFDISTGRNAFGIIGEPKSLNKQTTKTKQRDSVIVHCKDGEIRYIAKNKVNKSIEIMNHYKTFISKSAGDPNTDKKVISTPFFGDIDTVCTDTFFPIGCFDKREQAENLCKYLKTKFVRFLINVLKSSHNVTQIVYKFVPMQDFTNSSDIDWSKPTDELDKHLYAKYGLSQEEIDYIESVIKPMEE